MAVGLARGLLGAWVGGGDAPQCAHLSWFQPIPAISKTHGGGQHLLKSKCGWAGMAAGAWQTWAEEAWGRWVEGMVLGTGQDSHCWKEEAPLSLSVTHAG